MSDTVERRIRRGTAWVGLGASAVGALDAVTLVVLLRRWVTPAELGIATLASSLFPVLEMLGDMGLVAALVQRGEHDLETLSSVFWLNLLMVAGLWALLWVLAAPFGRFHGHPVVGQMLAAYGGKLMLQASWSVPNALLKHELRFRELAVIRMGAGLGDVAAKIGFAAAGQPVWCFVAGPLAYAVVAAAGMHGVRRWRPRLVLRPRRAAGHLAFGARSTGAQMLFQLYSNADYQVVGRLFGDAALGIYRVAYELILYPVHFLSGITVDVAFPSFARLRAQEDGAGRLAAQFMRFARQNLLLTLPVVALLLVEADDVLATFFPSCVAGATAARVLCAVGLLRSMSLLFPPLLDGLGRPGANLAVAGAAALVMPAAFVAGGLLLGPRLGMLSVALSWAAVYPLVFIGLVRFALPLLALSPAAYLRRMALSIAAAALVLAPLFALRWALGGWSPGPRLGALTAALLAVTLAWRPWRPGGTTLDHEAAAIR